MWCSQRRLGQIGITISLPVLCVNVMCLAVMYMLCNQLMTKLILYAQKGNDAREFLILIIETI